MNNFFGSSLPPDELQRQLVFHRRRQSIERNSQRIMNAAAQSTSPSSQQRPQHSPFQRPQQQSPQFPHQGEPSAVSNTPIPDGSAFDLSPSDLAQRASRRRSGPMPLTGTLVPDLGRRRMSVMEFGGSDYQLRDFQFGDIMTSTGATLTDGLVGIDLVGADMDAPSIPPGDILSTQIPTAGSSSAFQRANMMTLINPTDFSTKSPDFASNMLALSNLNVRQMPNDAAPSTDLFTGRLPPDANNMATPSPNFMDLVADGDVLVSQQQQQQPPATTTATHTTGIAIKPPISQILNVSQPPFTAGVPPRRSLSPTISAPPPNPLVSSITNVSSSARRPPINVHHRAPSIAQRSDLSLPPDAVVGGVTGRYQSPRSATSHTVSHDLASLPPTATTTATTTTTTPTMPTAGPLPPVPAAVGIKDKNAYSQSGFDALKALYLVATRKNPEIQLGAVDMSCAFVVCDVTLNDCPIIYASDSFQNLTGYSCHEIVGQNCRFLQAPDGNVKQGVRREFAEDDAVYDLKRKTEARREAQKSLINYRRGGRPFLNFLTMIPIAWDTDEIRYFVGFQIDLVECPDAISSQERGGAMLVNYMHSDIGQCIWTPPNSRQYGPESGQTLDVDDVSALLQHMAPTGSVSDWHRQSWDKMLLENTDDVVHVLSLKGLFLYLSPACKRVLEYDTHEIVGNSLSSICHPSDIVPVTRELKDTVPGAELNIVYRIRRKVSGYTWFESHGSLFLDYSKGRKCIILVGRKRPVYTLHRNVLAAHGGISDNEIWTKLSTSGLFLFVSSNVRSLLDLLPENLQGTSIQDLMRKESRAEFGIMIEKARRGKVVACKHEVHNKRGQVLQAQTVLYPGDAAEGQKPTFLLAQIKLIKASSHRSLSGGSGSGGGAAAANNNKLAASSPTSPVTPTDAASQISNACALANRGLVSALTDDAMDYESQDVALASDNNMFDELRTTRCISWQYELRQMEKVNRMLAEELGQLLSNKKKRKRRKGSGNLMRDCANCHTRNTPEWRRGPSGNRDLCNGCGLRWAKQTGRVSPRTSSRGNGDSLSKKSTSPIHSSPLHRELRATTTTTTTSTTPTTGTTGSTTPGSTPLSTKA